MANRSFFPVMHSAPQSTPQFPYPGLPTQMAYDPNRSVSAHPQQAIPPVNGRTEEFEWIEYINESGKSYYYNKVTKQSTWDKPTKFKPAARLNPAVAAAPNNTVWREYKNPEGRCYYHNPATNETTWTKPEGLQNASLGANLPEDVQFIGNNNIPAGIQKAPTSMPQLPQAHSSASTDIDKAVEATLKQLVPPNSTDLIPVETTDPVVVKQRAFERFKEMLLDKYHGNKINTNQSWDQAVRYIQHDPRFVLVNKVSEKKRIFNEWKAQQQKDDRDARRLAIRRAKEELEKFLLTSEKCRPSMPYQRADKVFREEERWRAVTESDRKDIYKDAMAMLNKKHEEEQKSQREKCQKLLNDLLDTLPEITYRTTWAQTQRILAANDFYLENDDLKQMDKVDALEVFMEYIRKAEREHAKEREQEEKMRRRESRKGRDAFYSYLAELNKQGIIKANSTWQTLFPKIRNDPRFSSMLINTGSTPLDMFKFFVEDLKSEFAKEKKKIKIILEKTDNNVNMETPFEEFEKWIRSEDPEKTISQTNLRICFDQLVDKAVSEDKDYVRKPSSGKEKRNEMPPLTLFEQISPRITVRSEWEYYKDKIMAELALSDTDEIMAETAFNEYIKALKDSKGDGKDISEGEVSDEDEEETKEKKEPGEKAVSRSKSRTRSKSISVEKEKAKKSKKEKKAKKSKKKKDKKHKSSKYEDISSEEEPRPRSRRRRRSDSDSSDRVKSRKARKEKQ